MNSNNFNLMVLYDKKTGKEEQIYGVLDDNCGYPKFLIRKNNQWVYRSAKHYITKEERLNVPYTKFKEINEVNLN